MIRLIAAGVFVFAALLAAVVLFDALGIVESLPAPVAGLLLAILMIFFCFVALLLFSKREKFQASFEENVRQLEEAGLLVEEDFRALRAFQVEEFEDEGSRYYLELADGRVLRLHGQFLYDYEPLPDESELNWPRRFPCSEFTLRRHRDAGYVVDLICRGEVLEPELEAPPLSLEELQSDDAADEVLVITDRSYETIKREHASRTAH